MSFLIPCPNCGKRSVYEFRFGGEVRPRPEIDAGDATWSEFLYTRKNESGPQKEWWYHRAGCRAWFQAVRHTETNEVLETFWP
ncbi:MAG: sarcosine oxidase subunit delta [candidate division Zixibacteria bacterium]|nr:sarcosine oxidase subunit delta [candidate division Zixibacteria bacterium]